jgi:hypothetical protein
LRNALIATATPNAIAIGVINHMPHTAMEGTESQFNALLTAACDA